MKKLIVFLVGCFVLGIWVNFTGCSSNGNSPSAPITVVQIPPTATPYCSSPTNQGVTSGGTNYFYGSGTVYLDAVTFVSNETAVSISLYNGSGPVSGQVRFGIYTNSAGSPGSLVIETNPQNIVASAWNTASLPNVFLAAGTYWLAFEGSNNASFGYANSGGAEKFFSSPWAYFPDTAPAVGSSTNSDLFYVSTCP